MLTREKALDTAALIEKRLAEEYGAKGRGLHEKVSSVQQQIDWRNVKDIRLVASLRNKAAHGEFNGVQMKDGNWDRIISRILDHIGRVNAFVIKGVKCRNCDDLRREMLKDTEHAAWQLYEGNIEKWFAYIGSANEAALAKRIRLNVNERDKGVGAFLCGECKQKSSLPQPKDKRSFLVRIKEMISSWNHSH